MQWVTSGGTFLNLSDTAVTPSPFLSTLQLNPNTLSPSQQYNLQLFVADSQGEATLDFSFVVASAPPQGYGSLTGDLVFTPLAGGGSLVSAEAVGWFSDDTPLSYELSSEVQLGNHAPLPLFAFEQQASAVFVVPVPAVTVQFNLTVCTAHGSCTLLRSTYDASWSSSTLGSAELTTSNTRGWMQAALTFLSSGAPAAARRQALAAGPLPALPPLPNSSSTANDVNTVSSVMRLVSATLGAAAPQASLAAAARWVAASPSLTVWSTQNLIDSFGDVSYMTIDQRTAVVDTALGSLWTTMDRVGRRTLVLSSAAVSVGVRADSAVAYSRLYEPLAVDPRLGGCGFSNVLARASYDGHLPTGLVLCSVYASNIHVSATNQTLFAGGTVAVHAQSPPLASLSGQLPPRTVAFLPGSPGVSGCAAWNGSVYERQPCLSFPSTLPEGVALMDSSASGGSWSLIGTLMDGCFDATLDCTATQATSDAALGIRSDKTSRVTFDPDNPQQYGAISCADVSGYSQIRVFFGTNCSLWRSDNSAGCFWNATQQAFGGPACMPRSALPAVSTVFAVQCVCAANLSDIAVLASAGALPSVHSTPSAPPPPPFYTAVIYLIVVVVSILVLTTSIAVWNVWREARSRAALLDEARSERMGFRCYPEDVWTWEFNAVRGNDPLSAPVGTAHHMASFIGLPTARLRLAIPESIWEGCSTAVLLGRSHGLSARALAQTQGEQKASVASLLHGGHDKIPQFDKPLADRVLSDPFVTGPAVTDQLVGTALMYAFIAWRLLLPDEEVSARVESAADLFQGLQVGGFGFKALFELFGAMLPALRQEEGWLEVAKIWRLVLSQRSDGSWECSSSIAAALLARSKHDDRKSAGMVFDDSIHCPTEFDGKAIWSAAPKPLRKLVKQRTASSSSVRIRRVWATMLVLRILESTPGTVLFSSEEEEHTAVDRGRAWLEARLAHDPELRELLTDSAQFDEHIKLTLARWTELEYLLVKAAQKSSHFRDNRLLYYLHRFGTEIVHATRLRHETFSMLLAPAGGALRPWQKALILGTLLLCTLLVTTFVYYLKARTCCSQVRTILGCPADPALPCRGYAGPCSGLVDVFAGVQFSGLDQYWTCHAFPDSAKTSDRLIVGIFASAAATPVTMLLEPLLEWSNERKTRMSWIECGSLGGVPLTLLGARVYGAWRWTRLSASRRLIITLSGDGVVPALLKATIMRLAGLCRCLNEEGELSPRARLVSAFSVVAALWAVSVALTFYISSWIVDYASVSVVYEFVFNFLIAYGVDQLMQWKSVYQAVFISFTQLVLKEQLGLKSAEKWWEENLDALSAEATLLTASADGGTPALSAQVLHLWQYRKQMGE